MARNDAGTEERHQWSDAELRFLAEHATDQQGDLVERFRKAFPKFSGSDQSIIGRRYQLIRGYQRAPEYTVRALDAVVQELREQLDELEGRRDEFAARAVSHNDAMLELSLKELAAKAKEAGVAGYGSKRDIVERLVAAGVTE